MLNIIWHESLDSTNSAVLRQIDVLDNLSVIAAMEQTDGRGQRGNRWLSRPGENLTFSLLLKFGPAPFPPLPAPSFNRLNLLAAVAVRNFLRDEGCEAAIKWPNDLYAGGRKICGILIENGLGTAGIVHSVIGTGINLNQREFGDLANATSLSLITGKQYDLHVALERVAACFEALLPALHEQEAYERLRQDYDAALFRKGKPYRYRNLLTGNLFTGVFESVSEDGRAVVKNLDDGSRMTFAFKELGYIL